MNLALLAELEPWTQASLGLAVLGGIAFSTRWLARWLMERGCGPLRGTLQGRWAQVLLSPRVLQRLAQMTPSLVVQIGIHAVPHLPAAAGTVIRNVAVALTVLHGIRALIAMLDALHIS